MQKLRYKYTYVIYKFYLQMLKGCVVFYVYYWYVYRYVDVYVYATSFVHSTI